MGTTEDEVVDRVDDTMQIVRCVFTSSTPSWCKVKERIFPHLFVSSRKQ